MRLSNPPALALALGCAALATADRANAITTQFFNPSQVATAGTPGATYGVVRSTGYQFRYSVDKYWSSYPGGPPTSRFFTVFWPAGVQAQAVTAGPSPGGAQITITRPDRRTFDLTRLSFKLLANTAGAGASLEIMPLLNGEDGLPNPLALDATGYGGRTFSYDTPTLAGFDTYKLSLYVDFAITGVTFADTRAAGDVNGDGTLAAADLQALLNGYTNHLTGWSNGDLNEDGRVSADDLALFNEAFALQPAAPGPVPEPSAAGLLVLSGFAAAALPARRR